MMSSSSYRFPAAADAEAGMITVPRVVERTLDHLLQPVPSGLRFSCTRSP